jgi:hypothetical protein
MITWYAMTAALMAVNPTATASVAGVTEPGSAPLVAPADAPAPAVTASVAAEAEPTQAPPAAPAPAPGSAPAEAAAKAAAPAPQSHFSDRFGGSQAWFQTSMNIGALNKGLNQDYNPTVQSFLSLSPRFAINKELQVRGRIGINYEWTDADLTTTRHVAQLTDTTLQLFYNGIPAFYGVKVQVAPMVILPTSNASNARTMRLTPALLTQVTRGFEVPGDGSLLVIGQASYQRPIYSYTTPGTDTKLAYNQQCGGVVLDSSCQNQLSPWANARDIFAWTLVLVGSWGDWAPGVAFQMSHQVPYHFSAVERASVSVEDPNRVRVSTSFSAWIDYTPLPWLTAELGYSFSRLLLNENSEWGNVIWDKYQDGTLYLGMNFGLDTLYKTITGEADDEGGVVRN